MATHGSMASGSRATVAGVGAVGVGAAEGAGYAGGILSAAIDGIKVAEALAMDILK